MSTKTNDEIIESYLAGELTEGSEQHEWARNELEKELYADTEIPTHIENGQIVDGQIISHRKINEQEEDNLNQE